MKQGAGEKNKNSGVLGWHMTIRGQKEQGSRAPDSCQRPSETPTQMWVTLLAQHNPRPTLRAQHKEPALDSWGNCTRWSFLQRLCGNTR